MEFPGLGHRGKSEFADDSKGYAAEKLLTMRGIWRGDRRDRVKWGGLFYLAERFGASVIVHVAMLRNEVKPILDTGEGERPIHREVWQHFSDLRQMVAVGAELGHSVHVIDRSFDPRQRSSYFEYAINELASLPRLRIAFLDPDTGIGGRHAGAEHVRVDELTRVWNVLAPGDVLAVYQHASRSNEWISARSHLLQAACDGSLVGTILRREIAGDVALLWCSKGPAAE